MKERTLVILKKECLDNARDRRAWSTVLLSVLLGPLMLVLLIQLVGRISSTASSRPTDLPVVGAELAPQLTAYLQNNNVALKPAPADPEAAVLNLEHDLVLVVPPEYPEQFLAGRPAPVRLIFDQSRSRAASSVARVRELLRAYSLEVGASRLIARGVSPVVMRALAVESTNLATPQSRASFLYSIVPMLLLIATLTGGMYIAIDTTAGERERGSLEPLLTMPITPQELIVGKLGATALYAGATCLLTLVGFAAVLNLVPLDVPGLRLGMSLAEGLLVAGLLLPVVLAGAAGLMLVSSHCRSFKEAQTAIQFVILLPMVPGMILQFVPVKPPLLSMLIPFFSQDYLILSVMKGEPISSLEVAVSMAATLAIGALLTAITIQRYNRQRVLFAL